MCTSTRTANDMSDVSDSENSLMCNVLVIRVLVHIAI